MSEHNRASEQNLENPDRGGLLTTLWRTINLVNEYALSDFADLTF